MPAFKQFVLSAGLDLALVVAYGKILRPWFLQAPRFGCINVHASLLPRLRGASPIHWAVVSGESCSGISIMKMDEGLDTGDVLLDARVDLAADETTGSLHDRLASLGKTVVIDLISRLSTGGLAPQEGLPPGTPVPGTPVPGIPVPGIPVPGALVPRPQDHAKATYAPKLDANFGEIDWTLTPREIDQHVRGATPFPGAFTYMEGERWKVHRVSLVEGEQPADMGAGRIHGATGSRILVTTGTGLVEILELQRPGGRRLDARSFLAGRPLEAGSSFESRAPWTRGVSP